MKYWFLILLLAGSAMATTTMKVVAIDQEKHGRLLEMDVDVVPGKGRILLSSLPFTGVDTQLSERQAVEYALRATNQQLGQRDIIFTFKTNVNLVEGQSAGAALALGVIGELEGKKPRRDAVVTGAIDPAGRLIGVGGVLEKALAAGEDEINILVVPPNTTRIVQSLPKQKTVGGEQLKFAEPVAIDVKAYVKDHWRMEVEEAGTIEEAMAIAFATEQPVSKPTIKNATVERRSGGGLLSAMGEDFLRWAEELQANSTGLEKARNYLSEGHEYAGANEAFLVWADAKTEADLSQLAKGGYLFEEEIIKLEGELDALRFPDGYNPETLNWHMGAQQRYVWARERLASLKDADIDDRDLLYNLNLVRGWLHISKKFLAQTKAGNLTFNIGLVSLVNELAEKADTEAIAALLLGQDTYGAFPLLSSVLVEKAGGWYLPAGYDAINAKARASSYDGEREQWRTVEALDGLEEKIRLAKETGLGVWPEMYLDGARVAIAGGDYRKAYLYATMARDFADFELKAMTMQSYVGPKPVVTEKIVKETTDAKAPPAAKCPELLAERLFRILEMLVARYAK